MKKLAAILLAVSFIQQAQAGVDEGFAAYQQKNYAVAIAEFKEAAAKGNAEAQNSLGFMYANGQGVTQNYPEALQWYRRAAEQGDAMAQHNLGIMYDEGRGVTQNYPEALKWYRRAAEQGHAGAQNNLGVMYQYAQGVAANPVLAHALYNLAKSLGNNEKAGENLAKLSASMPSAEITVAQALAAEMSKPGNFLKAMAQAAPPPKPAAPRRKKQ